MSKISKNHIGTLRTFVAEAIAAEKKKAAPYDSELLDDPGFTAKSVYVPDDIKKKIKKWAQAMGLSFREE